jgi:hypothetical protein
MSRVRSGDNFKILVNNGKLPGKSGTYTKNIVYKEALII